MHFISRRENEGIIIGDDIHVTVLEIREDHVRLAINSPNDTPQYWEETLYLEHAEGAPALQLH